MKRITILFSMLWASLFLLNSCMVDDRTNGGGREGGKVTLTVEVDELLRNGATSGASTRGTANVPALNGENTISSLYLLFFDGTGKCTGWDEVELPAPTVQNPDGGTEMNVDGIDFPSGFIANPYTIMALANVGAEYFIAGDANGEITTWMNGWIGKAESYVKANARGMLPVTGIASNRLPMHGTFKKEAGESQIHVLLSRDVARLDVTNTTEYKLMSASVWNAFPVTSIWGERGDVDFSSNTVRQEFHYTANAEMDGSGQKMEYIWGRLYAFDNQVEALSPESYHDKNTTCLIIGLQPAAGGATKYYRANLVNENGAHSLKRNYVYNLKITGVTPENGYDKEEIAYLGKSNGISYVIEEWSEDPNGLIVSDEYSTLSITTKTINMGGDAAVAELKVNTFSTLPSPAPLAIRSQTWRPETVANGILNGQPTANAAPIEARLDGNTLIIQSTDLGKDETERNGVIVLSYAGLEISLNVSQSGTHDHFLIVSEPDGGILPFAAWPGIASGLISVQASGHWTAKLYMNGFSFDNNTARAPVKTIWSDPDKDENNTLGLIYPDENNSTISKFRVSTHSANSSNAVRSAFIIVELDGTDKDGNALSEKYSSVIMLSQNFVKKLKYASGAIAAPAGDDWIESGGRVVFDGMGNLMTGPGYETNSLKWYIQAPSVGGVISDYYIVKAINGSDDREHFSTEPRAYSATDPYGNYITLKKPEMNTTGRERKIWLRMETDPGTYAEIEVIQYSASFDLSPGGMLANEVPYLGGGSRPISVVLGDNVSGLKWKIASAADLTVTESNTRDSRKLVRYGERRNAAENNPVTLELRDKNGQLVEFAYGREYDPDVTFRVVVPKLYFPNRDITPTVSVKVTVNSPGATSGGMTQSVRVQQTPLTARKITVRSNENSDGIGRGGILRAYYSEAYKNVIDYMANHTNYGAGAPTYSAGPFGAEVNVLHRNDYQMTASTAWTNTNAFIDNNDGVFSIIADFGFETGPRASLNAWGNPRGWTFVNTPSGSGYGGRFSDNLFQTKIWQFVASKTGGTPLSTNINTYGTTIESLIYHDGVSSYCTQKPESAISFVTTGHNILVHGIVIDPKTRVLYVGESLYVGDGNPSPPYNTQPFWTNIAFWIAYTARYGSGFSDLLIENEAAAGGGMPAPWDDWWGANKVESFNNLYGL